MGSSSKRAGMVVQKQTAKSVLTFALLGAVGFGIGGTVGSVIWGSPATTITRDGVEYAVRLTLNAGQIFLSLALIGALGGASLGLALMGWRAAGFLALAGAIGFSVMFQAVLNLEFEVSSAKSFGIWGAIAGATLGVALGYLEKGKVTKESSPPES